MENIIQPHVWSEASAIADSHCHILDPRLEDRVDKIVGEMKSDGLAFIVEVSSDPQEAVDALAFANKHEGVYCTCGVHPICAIQYSDDFKKWADTNCRKHNVQNGGKIVAFGEVGLDYHDHALFKESPYTELTMPLHEFQQDIFIKQIKLANRVGLPLVVHTRDSFEDTLRILREYKEEINNGLLIHCFSYGAEEAEILTQEFDAYFAFGGAVTYKNATAAEGAIRAVPLDRLLLETDSPYLSPVPLRGKTNEPKNVRLVCEHVARVLNMTTEEVACITLGNTRRFYNINVPK